MIYLRQATLGDREIVLAWHSHPLIYSGFYTIHQPLTWAEHSLWWSQTTKYWEKLMVVLIEDTTIRNIGFVRISALEDFSPQIAFTIGEITLWGQGYGKQAVSNTLDRLRSYGKHHVHTTVLETNKRAGNLLLGLGFEKNGVAREGEVWFQKQL